MLSLKGQKLDIRFSPGKQCKKHRVHHSRAWISYTPNKIQNREDPNKSWRLFIILEWMFKYGGLWAQRDSLAWSSLTYDMLISRWLHNSDSRLILSYGFQPIDIVNTRQEDCFKYDQITQLCLNTNQIQIITIQCYWTNSSRWRK